MDVCGVSDRYGRNPAFHAGWWVTVSLTYCVSRYVCVYISSDLHREYRSLQLETAMRRADDLHSSGLSGYTQAHEQFEKLSTEMASGFNVSR